MQSTSHSCNIRASPLYQVDPRWNLADPELGFIRKPNIYWSGRAHDHPGAHYVVYRCDENGFRNPPGITRAEVAFIGDSFTEAGNVPEKDTFVRLVGEKLGVTAVNLGREYYGPQQELAVLRRYALGYEPRSIVWVIFEGNDLTDAQRYLRGELQKPAAGRRAAWSSQALLTHRLLRPFLKQGRPHPKDRGETWLLAGPGGEEREVVFTLIYAPDMVQRLPRAWQATKRCLQQGLRLCRERGIELLVVFVPIKFRVYGPYLRVSTPEQRYPGPPPEDLSRPDDFASRMARFCKQIGCRFLDTYPALLAAATRGETVYSLRYDSHFDVAGHRVVADLISEVLSASGGGFSRASDPPGAALPPG